MTEAGLGGGAGSSQTNFAQLPVVFVINLARDRSRWERISTALERAGFQVVRIRAIDARRRSRWVFSKLGRHRYSTAMNRNLTPGECACALSHIAALKRVMRHGIASAIVMEDDAAMDHRFTQFVRDDLAGYLSKCAVVKIEGIEAAPRRGLILERGASSSLVLPFVPTQGAAAYAVTRGGADHLIKKFRSFSDPLDFMLSFYERLGCTYGEVRPIFIRQDNNQEVQLSNLQPEREIAYAGGLPGRSRIQRLSEIIVHDIGRRLWRVIVMAYYALRFRTVSFSVR